MTPTPAAAPVLPEPITTRRLVIRPAGPEDAGELNTAVRETFVDLHCWMEWATHIPTLEETEERLTAMRAQYLAGEDCTLAAFLREPTDGAPRLVLCTGLHPRDRAVPSFEIGYWRRRGFEGQGYVTEAVRALTRAGFTVAGAERIEIRCDERNIRSRRVAERAGYRLEGTFRCHQRAPDGFLRTTLVFAMVRADMAEWSWRENNPETEVET